MVSHAARLALGLPIYDAPSADFVPFFYTPGYSALIAWLSPLFGGVSLTLARSISICATLGTMGLLYWVVRRESAAIYGVIATGVYAALFRTSGDSRFSSPTRCIFSWSFSVSLRSTHSGNAIGRCHRLHVPFIADFAVFVPLSFSSTIGDGSRGALWHSDLRARLGDWLPINQSTDGWFWFYIFGVIKAICFTGRIFFSSIGATSSVFPRCFYSFTLFSYRVPIVGLSYWPLIGLALFYDHRSDFPHMYYRSFGSEPHWQIFIPPLRSVRALVYRVRNAGDSVRTPGFWLMFIAGAGAITQITEQWDIAIALCQFHYFSLSHRAWFARFMRPLTVQTLGLPHSHRNFDTVAALCYSPAEQIPTDADRRAYA